MRLNGSWIVGISIPVIVVCVAYLAHVTIGFSIAEAALLALCFATGLFAVNLSLGQHASERRLQFELNEATARLAGLQQMQDETDAKVALLIEHARRSISEPRPATAADLDMLSELTRELAEAVSAHDQGIRRLTDRVEEVEERQVAPPPAPVAVAPTWREPPPAAAREDNNDFRLGAAREAALTALSSLRQERPEAVTPAAEPEPTPIRRAPFPVREVPAQPAHAIAEPPSPAQRFVQEAITGDALDLYLQPVVNLPQRKGRAYRALLRPMPSSDAGRGVGDLREAAAALGLSAVLDRALLRRSVQLVRTFRSRDREAKLICQISGTSLSDAGLTPLLRRLVADDPAAASMIALGIGQTALRSLGPIETETLAALVRGGMQVALCETRDLRLNAVELAERGVRYVLADAGRLIEATEAGGQALEIHVADMANLLARHGIALVAENVDGEQTVLDLLDYAIPLAEGALFGEPRQVKAELLVEPAAPPAAAPGPAPEPRVSFRSLLRRASV